MENMNYNNSFNEYLKHCREKDGMKCVIVATDKQCVIKLGEGKNDDSHNELVGSIENRIHPNDEITYRLNNAYILLEGPELIANLPLDGSLSINQAIYLIDIFKKVCDFNKKNNDLIIINTYTNTDCKEFYGHNIEQIARYILSLITNQYIIEEEEIIGSTSIENEIMHKKLTKIYQEHYKN